MQEITDEIRVKLLKNRSEAAIKILQNQKTKDGIPLGGYHLNSQEAIQILQGLKDDELNLTPKPEEFS
jgi:hypothetical protein